MKNNDKGTHAYLTFALGAEKFAISVNSVQEIVELEQVTKVPNAPQYMLGIINLRGKVLPLLDTRLKLGLSKTEVTRKSRIMVIDLETNDEKNLQVGALVDVAREVIELSPSDIQNAPDLENTLVNPNCRKFNSRITRHTYLQYRTINWFIGIKLRDEEL